jgi:hypothetical protein
VRVVARAALLCAKNLKTFIVGQSVKGFRAYFARIFP